MSTESIASIGWVPGDDSFGARLALVRQRMGWNAKEAAIACGLPPQSWREWEGGRVPRDQEQHARLIADRTGCDYLWIFAGVRSRTPSPSPAEVIGQPTGPYVAAELGCIGLNTHVVELPQHGPDVPHSDAIVASNFDTAA